MFIDKSMTRDVITVDPEDNLLEAEERMRKHRIHQMPVVDRDNTVLGIITDRDLRSALPSDLLYDEEALKAQELAASIKVKEVMAREVITLSPANTLEDALVLMETKPVGAFPVVDEHRKLKGIISIRDLMRSFINVLGIHEPGTLLCILAEDKKGTMKRIVDAITEEGIAFGSILVARHWEEGKRALFPYLLSMNVVPVKRKLEAMGFKLLSPMEWYLDQLPQKK
jgi:acetoin utilization protein AcuB